MEMKKISSGPLRGLGYDERTRRLRVEFDNGEQLEYDGITREMWIRLSASTAPWSYYCDNIRDELTPRKIAATCRPASPEKGIPFGHADVSASDKKNPLDELFK